MAIEKFQPNGDVELFVYGEEANLEHFFGALEPLAAQAAANKSVSVGSHSRKRFIGDTQGHTVSAHSRTILVDPGAKNGNSLPGKPFVCVELDADGNQPEDGETRQFTYEGTFRDLHAQLVGTNARPMWLISPSGKKYKIAASE